MKSSRKARESAGSFSCVQCGAKFATLQALGGHKSVHSSSKRRTPPSSSAAAAASPAGPSSRFDQALSADWAANFAKRQRISTDAGLPSLNFGAHLNASTSQWMEDFAAASRFFSQSQQLSSHHLSSQQVASQQLRSQVLVPSFELRRNAASSRLPLPALSPLLPPAAASSNPLSDIMRSMADVSRGSTCQAGLVAPQYSGLLQQRTAGQQDNNTRQDQTRPVGPTPAAPLDVARYFLEVAARKLHEEELVRKRASPSHKARHSQDEQPMVQIKSRYLHSMLTNTNDACKQPCSGFQTLFPTPDLLSLREASSGHEGEKSSSSHEEASSRGHGARSPVEYEVGGVSLGGRPEEQEGAWLNLGSHFKGGSDEGYHATTGSGLGRSAAALGPCGLDACDALASREELDLTLRL